MRFYIKLWVFVFAFLVLTGCEEETPQESGPYDTVIEGYITERGTGDPIEGIPIDLFGPATTGPRTIITDKTGFYRFELGLQEDSRRFYVDFYGSNWYYNWPGEHRATQQGYNRIDGVLAEAGWVRLHLNNEDTWLFDDNIYFLHGHDHSYDSKVNLTLLLEFPANEAYIFKYQVTRLGVTDFRQDTIFPIGRDTIYHEILY
jgi:uncharacterized protein YneR